ncbi:heat shock protein 30 [Coccidioides immitis RS]|uniref:Heat shock protein 30 n=1 Tax=Coccidioides immitis (strain RS) TaxID=246410 RepID=J3KBZ3_COCIM|nr:heat shock protein 30 [Coccidioides immitis RS]EAS32692.3 heat shock protein 30 [Coccidioides immitis RS]
MQSSKTILHHLKRLRKTNVRVLKRPATLSTPRHFHNMALFPRLSAGDFTPLFHLLDDYDHHRSSTARKANASSFRSFSPSFDVREVDNLYLLDGELPGVKQKDIEIEFADEHTLVIKGRSHRDYTETNENEVADETESTKSSHQPTVEDEDASTPSTLAETPAESTAVIKQNSNSKAVDKKPAYKYWVTERSVGEFQRSFSFPARVNQDAVRASLKDGILHVVVPKATAPTLKKIQIE